MGNIEKNTENTCSINRFHFQKNRKNKKTFIAEGFFIICKLRFYR